MSKKQTLSKTELQEMTGLDFSEHNSQIEESRKKSIDAALEDFSIENIKPLPLPSVAEQAQTEAMPSVTEVTDEVPPTNVVKEQPPTPPIQRRVSSKQRKLSLEEYRNVDLTPIKELIESSNKHREQAENDLQKVVAIMSSDVEMIHRRVKDVRAVIGNSQSTGKIQESVEETKTLVKRLKETIEDGVHNFKHHRIGFETPFVCWTIIIETVLILGLFTWIIISEKPNQREEDNDLKYRYIKMKGDTSAEQIATLEEIFELNRNTEAIEQMREDVETYEEAVRKQAALAEQARLKEQAAKEQESRAKSIKDK